MSTRITIAAVALAVIVAGCAGGEPGNQVAAQPAAPSSEAAPTPAAEAPAAVHVLAGSTPLGNLLVGPDGRTLYGFTNDVEATSTCYGTCADAWPPVIVPTDWTAGPGLDFGIFATTVRDDGSTQLVAGKWPLYYFAGDAAPGDVNGQASGDVWFAVDLEGRLITNANQDTDQDTEQEAAQATDQEAAAPSSPITVATTKLGPTMADADGFTLYGFTNDTDGVPSCYETCADAWPPLLVDGAETPAGLDPALFSAVQRDDGTTQLVAGSWPLYRFAGDAAPGDVNGQASGGVWFAVDPDGGLITTDGSAGDNSDRDGEGYGGYGP